MENERIKALKAMLRTAEAEETAADRVQTQKRQELAEATKAEWSAYCEWQRKRDACVVLRRMIREAQEQTPEEAK